MMKHFVLFRFETDYLSAPLLARISDTFASLRAFLPEDVLGVEIRQNCVFRETNMELMVEMTLAGPASLDTYLEHPAHRTLVGALIPHITNRCSFDYMI